MAKYYYNGVPLPEIPADVLAEYPYAWIRDDKESGHYSLVLAAYPWYFNDGLYCSGGESVTEPWYNIEISTADTATAWVFNKNATGFFSISSTRTVLWSNHDIPNGSATSTSIYFYATELINEEEYVGGIQSDITSVELTSDDNSFELGTEYKFNETITALAIRIYAPSPHVLKGTLWDESGEKIAETNSVNCNSDQWCTLTFKKSVTLEAGKNYIVSAGFSSYYYVDSVNLNFSNVLSFVQSRYTKSRGTFPSTAFNSKVYGIVDIVYQEQIASGSSKYLIQSGDSLFTVTDGALVTVEGSVNADLFRTYGADEIPSSDLLIALTDPVVLHWTTEDEIDPLVAVEQAVPYAQTVESPDYNMEHSSILGIEKVFVDASDGVRFAVSFDQGRTWKLHTGEAWATLSEGDTGMSPSVLSAITTEDWNAEATTGKFRLRVTLSTVDDFVNSLVVDYLN